MPTTILEISSQVKQAKVWCCVLKYLTPPASKIRDTVTARIKHGFRNCEYFEK